MRLGQLKIRQLSTELPARLDAGHGLVESAPRKAEGGRPDRRAEDIERRHRDLESSARLTDQSRALRGSPRR